MLENFDFNKCYVCCVIFDVYEMEEVCVFVCLVYKKLVVVFVCYEICEECVMVCEGYICYEIIFVEFFNEMMEYELENFYNKLMVVFVSFINGLESIEVIFKIVCWEY